MGNQHPRRGKHAEADHCSHREPDGQPSRCSIRRGCHIEFAPFDLNDLICPGETRHDGVNPLIPDLTAPHLPFGTPSCAAAFVAGYSYTKLTCFSPPKNSQILKEPTDSLGYSSVRRGLLKPLFTG